MRDTDQELTVVSNRLPVVLNRRDDGWQIEPGSGGLVQAMNPILSDCGGRWVGWPGVTGEDGDGWRRGLEDVESTLDYSFQPVVLSDEEFRGYYRGFANSVIWPLFHGFADRCEFDPRFYDAYGRVNEKFASAIADNVEDRGVLWAQDYHLMQLARRLRHRGFESTISFFLHIPFPSVENFEKLPWRETLLTDLLHYDLVGFQSERDLRHFARCVEGLGVGIVDRREANGSRIRFELGSRSVVAGAFPIGIDYRAFSQRADSDETTRRVEQLCDDFDGCEVILGVDRLDYSKGLLHRLRAYEQALEQYPELVGEVMLFQLLVPSRESVPEYQKLKRRFDRLVGRINGRFSTPQWQPIRHMYDSVDPEELSALYRMASVALVTPLRDGMNLVSKEYCASQPDGTGVLVLSEFAGAKEQLAGGALAVNPYDTSETARAIRRAIDMPTNQRKRRMEALKRVVEETDVFWWADSFLEELPGRPATVQRVVGGEPEDQPRTPSSEKPARG